MSELKTRQAQIEKCIYEIGSEVLAQVKIDSQKRKRLFNNFLNLADYERVQISEAVHQRQIESTNNMIILSSGMGEAE